MIQNRYLVVQLTGQGAAGDTYLAVDQRFGSAVALKRVFYRGDVARLDAFEREANVLRSLNHPVLPKVIDHFTEDDGLFLVTEHTSGDDLGERVESAGKPFPVSWVMFWADQVLDALHYLHSHVPPIIHRDIRPQNLKLTGDNHIVLKDCLLSADAGDSAINKVSGGPDEHEQYYAAPEQVQGDQLDSRVDVYSLSATLYYLLTGARPALASIRAGAVAAGSSDPLRSLADVNPAIPQTISAVIMRALSLKPEDRFETALDMQRTLRRAFNKKSSTPRPEEATAQMRPPEGAETLGTDAMTAIMAEPLVDEPSSISMGATLQMDVAEHQPEPKQSGVKTEVFNTPQVSVKNTAPTEHYHAAPPQLPSAAPTSAAPSGYQSQITQVVQPKRSTSRAGLIIGIFAGLILLVGVVAGGGWFAYKAYYSAATPAETPEVPVATPSPAPTEPAVVIADENYGDTKSDPGGSTDPFEANSNTKPAKQATPDTPGTRAPPRITTQSTPARTPQKPPSTPKAQPRDDRTVILQ